MSASVIVGIGALLWRYWPRRLPHTFRAIIVQIPRADRLIVCYGYGLPLVPIHLWGVAAPQPDQPFGEQAIALIATLNAQAIAQVEIVQHGPPILAFVRFEDQKVNALLVERGLAWWDRYAPDFEIAELRARLARIGLWQTSDPIEPWRWHSTMGSSD
jgi:endonuclease YncB( thermonuclease family)